MSAFGTADGRAWAASDTDAAGAWSYRTLKRLIDLCGAILALIVLSPVLGVTSVMVLLFLGRPVLFSQVRVTEGEREFRIWKFRSMLNVDPERGLVTDEDRMTAFGRWLRSTSLDELPGLWNVVLGEMSLVGPRPLGPNYLPLYTEQQRKRHLVRGGLTGLAQVNGRNSLGWDEKFDLDVEYVESMSPGLDLRIALRTVAVIFGRDGITEDGLVTANPFGGTLRSDLVDFTVRDSGADLTRWDVRTPSGEFVGVCEMEAGIGRTAIVRCIERCGTAASDIRVAREMLSQLTNRARSSDPDRVLCCVPQGGVDLGLFAQLGYSPVDPAAGGMRRHGQGPLCDNVHLICSI